MHFPTESTLEPLTGEAQIPPNRYWRNSYQVESDLMGTTTESLLDIHQGPFYPSDLRVAAVSEEAP
jgi:hypothetical protein